MIATMIEQWRDYKLRRQVIEHVYHAESERDIELVTKTIVEDCRKYRTLSEQFGERLRLQMHFQNRLRLDPRWAKALSELLFM